MCTKQQEKFEDVTFELDYILFNKCSIYFIFVFINLVEVIISICYCVSEIYNLS